MTQKETLMHLISFLDSLNPLNLFVTPAHAQGLDFIPPEIQPFAPIVVVILLMYFLIYRPQNKKAKQHSAMIEALRRGDRVLTAGGIIGTVTNVETSPEIQIEIAENVRIRVVRTTLIQVLAKTEPYQNAISSARDAHDAPSSDSSQESQTFKKELGPVRKKSSSRISAPSKKTTKTTDI